MAKKEIMETPKNVTEPKRKDEKKKKPKKIKHPEKGKKAKKFVVEVFVITLVIAVGIFAKYIPFINENEDLMNIINNTLGKFFDIGSLITDNYLTMLETLTIVLFVWVINKLASYAINILFAHRKGQAAIALLVKSAVKYSVGFVGFIFVLNAWGVESTTILASLGLIGLALSFGAQGLIEDSISGLFLIFEKQFEIGDIVMIDGFRGQVYQMGIRTTKFMDPVNLDIMIMKNTDVKNLINASTKLSVAICDMSIEYGEDLRKIEELTTPFLEKLADAYPDFIIEVPRYIGVQALADSAVILRYVAKTTEDKKLQLQRILNRELKLLFDENNINIPFPQLVLHNEK
jgi:small-conductance mechanosensitive channel